MEGDNSPRITLRGEFLRAERFAARAVRAERQVAEVRRYAEMTLDSISIERRGMAQDVLAILDGAE